jgi:hypothetical protein
MVVQVVLAAFRPIQHPESLRGATKRMACRAALFLPSAVRPGFDFRYQPLDPDTQQSV